MTTGYQWAKKTKTRQLLTELSRKKNKFNAVKVTVDGETFDSKREALEYQFLKMRQRLGEITELKRQVKFELAVNGVLIATYKPDFVYWEGIERHVIDVKSAPTAKKRDFILIRKLMRAIHGIDVEIVGARSPALTEKAKAA